MGETRANLAALIGSRICHDLISPIGAINNGLELLGLTGAAKGPEMDLIADSADNAGARIRFFRIAFGSAGDQGLGASEIEAVLRDMSRGSRLQILWHPQGTARRAEVRLAFLAILCLETALPYGGTIDVSSGTQHGAPDPVWHIRGRGEKVMAETALWSHIADQGQADGPEITPALVQFALLPDLARDSGRSIAVDLSPNDIRLTF
jgi:histidine phosphotransferase ChpT